jgi:peptidoglycan/LPS O-acetylase OafA/YrhL
VSIRHRAMFRSDRSNDSGRRRADVQGLRAFAVLAVVAFHAGLPVPGGFAGVDVFFVISGFVITAMLRREWRETGRIDLVAFYKRRFKRLAPALALVVGATVVATALFLSPLGAQQRVAKTGLGAMLFFANWAIASTVGRYFDAPAAANPLLHTWSLSVEEQFYLVFPALLLAGWLLARRRPERSHAAAILVGLVALLSFGTALVGVQPFTRSWLFGFYSPLARAWEFAAGALVALLVATLRSRALAAAAALAGAALLAASLWALDGALPDPSVWTLLPVVGTTLLLVAGGARNPVTRVLALRPLVAIGDWSYSIYLWHWPLIVFAHALWPESADAPRLAALVAFAPALLSYRYLENPLRRLPALPRRRFVGLVAAVVLSPLAVDGAMAAVADNVWLPRYEHGALPVANRGDTGQRPFFAYLSRTFPRCAAGELRQQSPVFDGVARCRQSRRHDDVRVAVIGDSHAEHLFLGLADALPRDNVAYYLADAPPLVARGAFARIVDHVDATPSIKTVVVSAYWHVRGIHSGALAATLTALRRAGKTVFVTDDVPFFPFEADACKFRQAPLLPTKCARSSSGFWRDYGTYFPQLLATARAVPGVHVLRTAHYFCHGAVCGMAQHGVLLYRDDDHLNINGSRFLADRLLGDDRAFAAAVRR